jgi:hypothetical protein
MTITAKYPGKCAVCGERFAAGEQINWRKGEPSSHATCSSQATPEPVAAPESSGGKASAGHAPPRTIRSIDF